METADRATLLVDGAAYFQALRRALLKAERQVLLIGWDVDGRTDLLDPNKQPDDDAPDQLRALLSWLVDRRPNLHVQVLLWDYTLLYAMDRELLPTVALGWATPDRVHLHLDDTLPIEASHHEKVVVIDDALAFCGGMDVTIRRWDTPDHRLDDPRRRDPSGDAYPPVHDVTLMVDGAAARALGDLARERWQRATGNSCWPLLKPPVVAGAICGRRERPSTCARFQWRSAAPDRQPRGRRRCVKSARSIAPPSTARSG